jgi:hypothetical protein
MNVDITGRWYIKQLYILILDLWHKSGILLVHGKQISDISHPNYLRSGNCQPKYPEFQGLDQGEDPFSSESCYEIIFDCALINCSGWFTRQKVAAPGKLPLRWPRYSISCSHTWLCFGYQAVWKHLNPEQVMRVGITKSVGIYKFPESTSFIISSHPRHIYIWLCESAHHISRGMQPQIKLREVLWMAMILAP